MVANQLWCRKTIFISTNFLSTHTNAQVSVLTDQVEAQGAKISDLQSSLVEHQQKLDSTEEMLQQVRSCIDLKSEHLTLEINTKRLMYYQKQKILTFTKRHPRILYQYYSFI